MALTALFAQNLPLIFLAGVLSIGLSWWVVRFRILALSLLFLSLVAGQLLRIPLPGQGGGLLVSDIAVVAVLLSALSYYFRNHSSQSRSYHLSPYTYHLFLPFIVWSLFTLVVNISSLANPEIFVALSYWVRLCTHLLLVPALIVLFYDHPKRWAMVFVGTVLLLAVLGFLQLTALPSLVGVGHGWDPHQNRLVSTWLDPNFLGGALAMSLPWSAVFLLTYGGARKNRSLKNILLLSGIVLALLFTKSRSGVIALIGALAILSPFYFALWVRREQEPRIVRFLAFAMTATGLIVVAWMFLGERAQGVLLFDPTVELRLQALREVWYLATQHSFVGVGYNAYQFAALEAGLVGDFATHSRAGADNSMLTLWVTTGVIGVLLFIWPWITIVRSFFKHTLTRTHILAVAAATSLLAWFIHSQFVNSLLYSHLLIMAAVIIALTTVLITTEVSRHD